MKNCEHICCDRCKKMIKPNKFPVAKIQRVKEVAYFGHGPYSYYESNHVLCTKCGLDFDKFMEG